MGELFYAHSPEGCQLPIKNNIFSKFTIFLFSCWPTFRQKLDQGIIYCQISLSKPQK